MKNRILNWQSFMVLLFMTISVRTAFCNYFWLFNYLQGETVSAQQKERDERNKKIEADCSICCEEYNGQDKFRVKFDCNQKEKIKNHEYVCLTCALKLKNCPFCGTEIKLDNAICKTESGQIIAKEAQEVLNEDTIRKMNELCDQFSASCHPYKRPVPIEKPKQPKEPAKKKAASFLYEGFAGSLIGIMAGLLLRNELENPKTEIEKRARAKRRIAYLPVSLCAYALLRKSNKNELTMGAFLCGALCGVNISKKKRPKRQKEA